MSCDSELMNLSEAFDDPYVSSYLSDQPSNPSPSGTMKKSESDDSLVSASGATTLASTSEKAEENKKESRRKRLLRKAPDAPKRFKSAYICYVIEKMDEVKKTLADDVKVTEAMKILALMWRELPPETKMEYQKIAADDKSRYFAEMKDYTGPMHIPNKRQKKPAGAPKRAMSAFLSFSQQMRPQVRAKYPELKNTDISGVLAQLWKQGTEEEKAPHIDRELREREKYHEDMTKWKEEAIHQAEVDAIAAAEMADKMKRQNSISAISALGSDHGQFGMNSLPQNNVMYSDNYGNDFLQNVWNDGGLNEGGWSEVDKLLRDADGDKISSNVKQDFFGGDSEKSSQDITAIHALHQDSSLPRALPPSSSFMMPSHVLQGSNGLLPYPSSSYNGNGLLDTRPNSTQYYMQYDNQRNSHIMQQQQQYPEQMDLLIPNLQDDMHSSPMQRQQLLTQREQFINPSTSIQQQEQQRRMVMMQHYLTHNDIHPPPMRPYQPEPVNSRGTLDPFYEVSGSKFSADRKQSSSSSR